MRIHPLSPKGRNLLRSTIARVYSRQGEKKDRHDGTRLGNIFP
jgi:hypothetical protein